MKELPTNEKPIPTNPSLELADVLAESIILERMRTLEERSAHVVDGERWIIQTYEDWHKQHFPFWSTSTIQRKLTDLEEKGLIASANYSLDKSDNPKWYRLRYRGVEENPVVILSAYHPVQTD